MKNFCHTEALKKVVTHHERHIVDLQINTRTKHDMLGRVLPTRKVESSKEH